MNKSTQTIESMVEATAGKLVTVYETVADIEKIYFATTASTLIGAVSSGTTAVTVSSKLTKTKFVNGIILSQNLKNWVSNAAVSTTDNLSHCENLINGSDMAGAVLSQDIEALGTRMQSLASTLVTLNNEAQYVLNLYSAAQLSGVLAALSGDPVVLGCSTTKTKFAAGVNLIQQFRNLMTNAAVAQGDYYSILSQWTQGI